MKKTTGMCLALAAAALAAGWGLAADPVEAVSDAASLDTRSFTVDWSAPVKLSTKKIVGTLIIMK